MIPFIGSGVALVTPFQEEGVNFEKLARLIEWHIEQKTDAIIICGTTGEAATMTEAEKKSVIKFTVDCVKKRIPVIAGSGSNNTAQAIEMSQYCERVGVDGLLVVTPYYNKGNESGLEKHYKAIANSVSIPIILYNVPSRTGVNLNPTLVHKLSQVENIVGIKEASGDISQVAQIMRLCGDDFYLYSGNDDQVVPLLSLGGKGVISVVANILPKEMHEMVRHYLNQEIEVSRKLQLKLNALVPALFLEVNPIPVKTAMNLLGMEVGGLRLPLDSMSEGHQAELVNELIAYGLLARGEKIC